MVTSFVLASANFVSAEVERVKPLKSATDGVYGRFDGDITGSLQAAIGVGLDSGDGFFRASAGLQFLSTLGIYLSAISPSFRSEDQALTTQRDADRSSKSGRSPWLISTGIELRPLFLPRWALNLEQGPAWLDLTLDSLAFFGGVVVPLSEESTSSEFGVALGTPISGHFKRPASEGLWLDFTLLRQARAGGYPSQSTLWLGLSWRSIHRSGLLAP